MAEAEHQKTHRGVGAELISPLDQGRRGVKGGYILRRDAPAKRYGAESFGEEYHCSFD